MAQLAVIQNQFFNSSGVPLSGGKVFTYEAGTTTLKATYTDATGLTQNTNPVILNSRGEAQIWMSDSLYKVVLSDSVGSIIYTQDNIAPLSSVGIGYLPSGTGALPTTVQSKLREIMSVKDFGAKGDGVTNDTAAIQAAIDAALAAGGGKVYVPKGTYIVGSLVMKNHVELYGDGVASTILSSSHTGYGLKTINPVNSSTAAWTIVRDLRIVNSNGANVDGGIVDVGGTFVLMENVLVQGFKYGCILDQTELSTVRQCHFTTQLFAGMWLVNNAEYSAGAISGFSNRITVQECQFNQAGTVYGVVEDGGVTHSFINNNFNGCSTQLRAAGVTGLTISESEWESCTVCNVSFNLTTAAGAGVGTTSAAIISGNMFTTTAGASGNIVNNSGVAYLTLQSNILSSPVSPSVALGASVIAEFITLGNSFSYPTAYSGAAARTISSSLYGAITPGITIGGATTGITYSKAVGRYQIIGDVCTFTMDIELSNKGALAGSVLITGLPVSARVGMLQNIPGPYAGGLGAGFVNLGCFVNGGSTISVNSNEINTIGALTDASLTNSSFFILSGSYFI
jgi:hypothetical protein